MGKGEIARNKQFLLFSQCFLHNQIIVYPFVHIFDIISAAAEFKEPKIGISGKGLKMKAELKLLPVQGWGFRGLAMRHHQKASAPAVPKLF